MPSNYQFFSSSGPEFASNVGLSNAVGASNTAKWMALGSAAAITLTPGEWRASAYYLFTGNNIVGYGVNQVGWFGAAGTGTTVAPANISSVAGFSVCAGAGLSGFNIHPTATGASVMISAEAPTIRVFTNAVQPIFFGMNPQGNTLGAAITSFWLYGEKVR